MADMNGYQDPAAIANSYNAPVSAGVDPSQPGWLDQMRAMLQAHGIDLSQFGFPGGQYATPGGGGTGAPPQQGQPSSGNPWTDAANKIRDMGQQMAQRRQAAALRRQTAPGGGSVGGPSPINVNPNPNPAYGGQFAAPMDFGGGTGGGVIRGPSGVSQYSDLLNSLKLY